MKLARRGPARIRRAFTLVELMIVLTVMAVMMSFAAPTFHKTIIQANADAAASTLRSIWTAQRLYWIENRTYSSDLATLEQAGLVDPTVLSTVNGYTFAVTAASTEGFTISATLTGSAKWSGSLFASEAGNVTGVIQAVGERDIVPGDL